MQHKKNQNPTKIPAKDYHQTKIQSRSFGGSRSKTFIPPTPLGSRLLQDLRKYEPSTNMYQYHVRDVIINPSISHSEAHGLGGRLHTPGTILPTPFAFYTGNFPRLGRAVACCFSPSYFTGPITSIDNPFLRLWLSALPKSGRNIKRQNITRKQDRHCGVDR